MESSAHSNVAFGSFEPNPNVANVEALGFGGKLSMNVSGA